MIEEVKLLNHWLLSRDPGFLVKHKVDASYFSMESEPYQFIVDYINEYGETPSLELVRDRFQAFKIHDQLEPVDYLIEALNEQRVHRIAEPILLKHIQNFDTGDNIISGLSSMKTDIEKILRTYVSNDLSFQSWNRDSMDRYDSYMEKHGQEGIPGLPTGLPSLDELTGGWREDDLILLSARTNEGKSLLALFFAFQVWQHFVQNNILKPVVYITTEMPELEIFYRLDTLKAHFSNRALNEGKLPEPSIYREYLEGLPIYKPDFLVVSQDANGNKPFTPTDIRSIIEIYDPGFVVIDQLYDLSDGTGEKDLRRKIVNISTSIRDINLQTKTPMILVSQAGRDAAKEAKRDPEATPELYQIQESDNPAQKATRVITMRMFLDKIKITLRKNRGGIKDKNLTIITDIDTGVWDEIDEMAVVF